MPVETAASQFKTTEAFQKAFVNIPREDLPFLGQLVTIAHLREIDGGLSQMLDEQKSSTLKRIYAGIALASEQLLELARLELEAYRPLDEKFAIIIGDRD